MPAATQATVAEAIFWLTTWFVNNLMITIANKSIYQFVKFPYPYTLSAVHMLCNSIGAYGYIYGLQSIQPQELTKDDLRKMLGFSALFAANIVVGNASLKFVSVSFNQVMRATVPGISMLLSYYMLNKEYSMQRKMTVVPVVSGVALACYGEMQFSFIGFWVTVLCVILAGLKAVVSSIVLTGRLKMHPIDLIRVIGPMAFVQMIVLAVVGGEASEIYENWYTMEPYTWTFVFMTGCMAFTLNVSSFYANKVTSALTLTVCGNVKQVMTIVLAVFLFQTPISTLNGLGIVIVILGSFAYSFVGYNESRTAQMKQIEATNIPKVSNKMANNTISV